MLIRPKVLIVEDESIIATEIKRFVERIEYKVIDIVTNYDDAIKCASEEMPDILLLDINLGKNKKTGIEVAKEILKIKKLPIIYLTANVDDDTIYEAAPTEPIGYVSKPYSRDTLRSTLILASTKLENSNIKLIKLDHSFFFNLENLELFQNNTIIRLSKKEKQMLKVLIEANNEIVSTETLEYELYGNDKNVNGALRGLIHRFRTKLKNNILESIHSYGFRIRRLN